MSQPSITPGERYAALVEQFPGDREVERAGRGFGADALKAHGKIFAMLSGGRLIVKLPRQRVDALVASGDGERFDPRHDGRRMKEWLALAPTSQLDWLALAREARAFVGATPSAARSGLGTRR